MALKRIATIDTLRGFAILNVIVYHTLWDLDNLFGFNLLWFHSEPIYIWQQCGSSLFIFLSGFCRPLCKSTWKQCLKLTACSLLISGGSYLFAGSDFISFGILSLFASCFLLFSLFQQLLQKLPYHLGFYGSLLLFLLTKKIAYGFVGIGSLTLNIPNSLYANWFTAWLGLPPNYFYSADYFPLLPWFFIFSAGYFAGREFFRKKTDAVSPLLQINIPPLNFLGKHSLATYLVHQPIIYAILTIII